MTPTDKTVLAVFYGFNMTGQIVLTLSFVTAAVARLGREMLLINIGLSMVIFSTACLLLLYAGANDGPEPPFGLCLTQACLIYGSLTMGACSGFGLFFQLWSGMRAGAPTVLSKRKQGLRVSFRIAPWLIFFGVVLGCIIDGLRDRREVRRSRDFFYCSASQRMAYTCEILCGLFVLPSVLVEGHVLVMLVSRWRAGTLRREMLPMDSLVRLGLFTFYGIFTVITAIVLINFPNGTSPRYPFIFMSTLPLAVWMIFWTQKDILRIWLCRRGLVSSVQVYESETQRLQARTSSRTDLVLRSMRAEMNQKISGS